ncbi:glycine/D-amino acid oxidase-like deaminating enzyme [Bradyrhizobium sp. LB7.2]
MTGNERNAIETYECDVLVAGSGASGMSAAITARYRGLDVLIVEKEPRFGGTTARSGGWLWIPGTSLAKAYGIEETPEQARTYLRHEAGNNYDAARVDAFLSAGPEAVGFFTSKTALRFDMPLVFPDYHAEVARRHPGWPFDGGAPVRRPRARRPDQDPRHAPAGADRIRHDARIRQGHRPFHARDEVADLGRLCRKAPVAPFDGRAALRPRHDPDQRQCARRAPGKIRARPEDSDVAVLAGA